MSVPACKTTFVTLRGPEHEGAPREMAFWSAFSLQQLPHLPLGKHPGCAAALPGWDLPVTGGTQT